MLTWVACNFGLKSNPRWDCERSLFCSKICEVCGHMRDESTCDELYGRRWKRGERLLKPGDSLTAPIIHAHSNIEGLWYQLFRGKFYVCDSLDFGPSLFEWAWMMRKVKTNHVATLKMRWLPRDSIGLAKSHSITKTEKAAWCLRFQFSSRRAFRMWDVVYWIFFFRRALETNTNHWADGRYDKIDPRVYDVC